MRIQTAIFTALLTLGTVACARRDTAEDRRIEDRRIEDRRIEERGDTAARKAGGAAYKVAEETKEAAKKVGHELRVAGKEARDGWNDAKHDERTKPRPSER